MSKPILYIDVDDTIYAQCVIGCGMDLRPGIITQLRILAKLFRCRWLTCWGSTTLRDMWRGLFYCTDLNKNILYADWDLDHPLRKAGYVLDPKHDQDFYWLEDPLCPEEVKALQEAGKLDRYIPVAETGYDGFAVACQELFRRAGITDNHLKRVGAKPEWFAPLTPGPHALPPVKYTSPGERLIQEALK